MFWLCDCQFLVNFFNVSLKYSPWLGCIFRKGLPAFSCFPHWLFCAGRIENKRISFTTTCRGKGGESMMNFLSPSDPNLWAIVELYSIENAQNCMEISASSRCIEKHGEKPKMDWNANATTKSQEVPSHATKCKEVVFRATKCQEMVFHATKCQEMVFHATKCQ